MDKLAVVIVAKDESENLKELLPELRWADEVIVQVDDRTSDSSYDIAERLGAKVSREKFADFSQFKNTAIGKATGDWILFLDADERVSEKLRKEIKAVLSSGGDFTAYEFPWKNYLGQTWLRHGGLYPDYHTRLFRRGQARYSGEVHEKLHVNGNTGRLSGPVIHHTYKDVSDFRRKVNFYSSLEGGKINPREKSLPRAFISAVKRFVKVYLVNLGFLDGEVGFINAWELARYQWRVYR